MAQSKGANANELLNSDYDNYYEYLELTERTEAPHVLFRAYSNNDWKTDPKNDGPWQHRTSLDRVVAGNGLVNRQLLDSQLFGSYNSAYARGYDDGAMWQGRGLNSSISGGVVFKSKYFAATLAPLFWVAQNRAFSIVPSHSWNNPDYGYFVRGIDYPQRFGDDLHYEYNWGQSGLRFDYRAFTIGFSNENIIIGPSRNNSLLMTNNASGFPHFDLGFNKADTFLGVFELRMYWGMLAESSYFDDDPANDDTYISGFAFAYSFPFLKSLTFGASRVAQTAREQLNTAAVFAMFDLTSKGIGSYGDTGTSYGYDKIDQKISFTAEWKFPTVGFNVYFDYFKEDYTKTSNFVLIPEHASGYMIGAKQAIDISNGRGFLLGAEIVNMSQSRDYELYLGLGSSYYTHHINVHGYTHKGQLLGSPLGTGKDGQFLTIDYYDTWGKVGFTASRIRNNMDYVYALVSRDSDFNPSTDSYRDIIDAEMSLGLDFVAFAGPVDVFGEFMFSSRANMNFIDGNLRRNVYVNLGLRYRFGAGAKSVVAKESNSSNVLLSRDEVYGESSRPSNALLSYDEVYGASPGSCRILLSGDEIYGEPFADIGSDEIH